MSFQTRKAFVHLQNTNLNIFLMESESFLTLHRQQQTCQPVRILRSGHAFWPQSTQVRFVTLNYAKTWWRLCARTVAYLNHATATKEDFDQSERWVHSPSNMWDDWQMRNVRPIIKKRLQIDSKTKSRSVSRLFTPAVWFLKRGQYTRYLQPGAPLWILGPLDSIFTRALLRGGLYIIEIAIAFPSRSFFPLLPNQIILFQLLKSFSFVCNGKVIIFRFGFL